MIFLLENVFYEAQIVLVLTSFYDEFCIRFCGFYFEGKMYLNYM